MISGLAFFLSVVSVCLQYFVKPKIKVRLVRNFNGGFRTEKYNPTSRNDSKHIVYTDAGGQDIVVPLEINFFLEINNVGHVGSGVSGFSYDLWVDPRPDEHPARQACKYESLDDCYLLRGATKQVPLKFRLPQNWSKKECFNCRYSIEALRVEGPFGFVGLDQRDLAEMNTIIGGVPFEDA